MPKGPLPGHRSPVVGCSSRPREDIPLLAETFLQRHITDNTLEPRRFTREALRALEQYDWPGNVRQLSHVIESAVTLSNGAWLDAEDLGLEEVPRLAARHVTSS